MVFTTEGFFEVAIESWFEWDLNPRSLNSVHIYIYILQSRCNNNARYFSKLLKIPLYIHIYFSKLLLRNRKLLQKHFDGRFFSIFDMQINCITHFTILNVKSPSQLNKYMQT